MSVHSGGGLPPMNSPGHETPLHLPEDPNAKLRREVCRTRDFELTCLPGVDVNTVVDTIIEAVNPSEDIDSIQQINNKKYVISFKTTASAENFLRKTATTLRIPGTKSECRWLGAEHKKLKIAYLPAAVSNSALESVLKQYGTVIQTVDEMYTNKATPIKTGTRIVDLLMVHPVPNIITVNGFSVPVIYKGVKIQCRRCQQVGHIKADCETKYCYRCKTFGHEEEECTAPCLKCKSPEHHWKDCTVRSYSFAVSNESTVATAAALSGLPSTQPTEMHLKNTTDTQKNTAVEEGEENNNTEKEERQQQQQQPEKNDNNNDAVDGNIESNTDDARVNSNSGECSKLRDSRTSEGEGEQENGNINNPKQGEGNVGPTLRERKRKDTTPEKGQPDPKKAGGKNK